MRIGEVGFALALWSFISGALVLFASASLVTNVIGIAGIAISMFGLLVMFFKDGPVDEYKRRQKQ